MNLLLVNGNSDAAMTTCLAERARKVIGPAVNVVATTAAASNAYVRTRRDCAMAAASVVESVERQLGEAPEGAFDAVLLACFGEPGLAAVREITRLPVLGMAEASVFTALQLGQRFSIVTPGRHWPRMLEDLLHGLGVARQCLGIAPVVVDDLVLPDQSREALARVRDAVERQRRSLDPDVIVIGGAAFAGFANRLEIRGDERLVDSFDAALCQALGLMRLRRLRSSAAVA